MNRSKRLWSLLLTCLAALALMAPKRPDPGRNTSFRLELDGSSLGFFKSVQGLAVEIEVVEFRDGGDPLPRKLPGRVSVLDLTLTRAYVNPSFFENWIQQVRDGAPGFRKDLTLVVLDSRGNEVATYNFVAGWPSKWELSSENAKGNDIMVETITITHEGFSRQ
jgi:phage tail-like protein